MVFGEAELSVHGQRCLFPRIDVKASLLGSPAGHVAQTRDRKGFSQARPMPGRVDAHDVDLTAVRVDLRPAETGDPLIVFGDQEALGVEPVFFHPALERLAVPCALLGVMVECAIVHLDPLIFVAADFERTKTHARRKVRFDL